MNQYRKIIVSIALVFFLGTFSHVAAQKPYRVGTTAANFLEMGFGSAGISMGDAYVASANDLTSIYWNPAGLGLMSQNEAQFMIQPYFVDTRIGFAGAGLVMPAIGTLSLGLYYVDYGDMEVTTLELQDGTGEMFNASDYAFNLSFGRRITDWFSFGMGFKFVSSQIWHMSANAIAGDLGVIVQTDFLSPNAKRKDGLKIGMSISNYGSKMRYDGIDLLNPIDILPNENGNFEFVPGQFRTNSWELPLIFRVGVAMNPIVTGSHKLLLAVDALHPNNNTEYVNLGAQYEYHQPTFGKLFLRGGYKALFMEDSEFGMSLGAGLEKRFMNNLALKLDYAYRHVGVLGNTHTYSVGILF